MKTTDLCGLILLLSLACGNEGEEEATTAETETTASTPETLTSDYAGTSAETSTESTAYQTFYSGTTAAQLQGEYFAEMFLYRGLNDAVQATSRMIASPAVYLNAADADKTIAREIAQILPTLITEMTGGVLTAEAVLSGDKPTDRPVIEFMFGNTSGAVCVGGHTRDGNTITAGTITCDEALINNAAGYTDGKKTIGRTMRHELGHILTDTAHSGMAGSIMAYNTASNMQPLGFPEFELNAWTSLYQHDAGTTVSQLEAAGTLTAAHLDPPPYVIQTRIHKPNPYFNSDGTSRDNPSEAIQAIMFNDTDRGAVGFHIRIEGNRFPFRWGCSQTPTTIPTVSFGGVVATGVSFEQPAGNDTASGAERACPSLIATIPAGAVSGKLTVTARGLVSNELDFEIFTSTLTPDD